MIHSNNLFLIREQIHTQFEQINHSDLKFFVAENGVLEADFLQTTDDLNVQVVLEGIHSKCDIKCCYLCNKNNKININVNVLHKLGKTSSSQKIKGIVLDNASVSFSGTITIPYDSQQCDGYQNHRGIVLSNTAKISAVPQLEIWADDVKCAHGSAVGPLDENQIFYLQTRGLSEKDAKKMLLFSFFNDFITPEFEKNICEWMTENV